MLKRSPEYAHPSGSRPAAGHPAGFWRAWLIGALSTPVLLAALTVATVAYWPEVPGLRTAMHILDSLVFHMAAATLAGLGLLRLLRAPRILVLAGLVPVLLGVALTVWHHRSVSQPFAEAPASLRVLWFNMLIDNPTAPEVLAQAVIDSPADILVLSEPYPMFPALDMIDAAFAQRRNCDRLGACEMMVLSRRSDVEIEMLPVSRTGELRVALITVPDATAPNGRLTLVATHLSKPWFFGFSDAETGSAVRRIATVEGPLVVMGDFNAAPWSRRMRHFTGACALDFPRWPLATWPTGAGSAGLAIDHVMVRDAGLVSLQRWGEDLGSNHAGLLAEVAATGGRPARAPVGSCARLR